MPSPKKKSLALKLLVVSAVAITTLLTATFFVVIMQMRDRAETMTLDQALTDARANAMALNTQIGILSGSTRALAGTVEAGLTTGTLDRAGIVQTLKPQIEKFDTVFGSWVLGRPEGMEDTPSTVVSDMNQGTNSAGQFTPYWTRDGAALKLLVPEVVDYTVGYYADVASTLKGTVTEPYSEATVGGMLMMSIIQPVIVNGKFRAVAGIDVGLKSLADLLTSARPFGSGHVYLMSAKGQWLVAPDDALLLKSYDGAAADAPLSEQAQAVQSALSDGQSKVLRDIAGAGGETVYRVVLPFALPGLNANWAVIEDVPVSVISSVVNQQTVILVIGGLVILVAVMLALFLAIRIFVQKPMRSLLGEVGRLSDGKLDESIGGQARADEIGEVAVALEAFRHKLAHGRELEQTTARQRAEAEEQRQRSESERSGTEAERQQNAETQRAVVESLGRGLAQLADGNLSYRIAEAFPGAYERVAHGL